MRAGQLNQRVTIQEQCIARDSYGAETVTWKDLATVWAEVVPSAGGERWLQGLEQRIAERVTRIRMRYRGDVTEKMQILFGAQVFDVQQMSHSQTGHRELVLLCHEVNPAEA
jgi:SPP1 family predicted phage head-tail adaptor